jgi:hypothetical protein
MSIIGNDDTYVPLYDMKPEDDYIKTGWEVNAKNALFINPIYL